MGNTIISVVCYCGCIFWNMYYLIGLLDDEVVQFQPILRWPVSYSAIIGWMLDLRNVYECVCVCVYVCMYVQV